MPKKVLERINSKYILEYIFNYIKNDNLKFELFRYSKLFQKLLKFELFDYQQKYFTKKKIYLEKYLLNACSKNNYFPNIFQKDLSKFNIDFNQYLINKYFKVYLEKIKQKKNSNFSNDIYNDNNEDRQFGKSIYPEVLIDINSPFFDKISKNSELFEEFSIFISLILNDEDPTLSKNFSSIFDNMNNNKYKYSSITINKKIYHQLNILKEIKINIEQIKRLTIKLYPSYKENYKTTFSIDDLLSLNFHKNLTYLYLGNSSYYKGNANSFQSLEKFESLKHLVLCGIIFQSIFHLKLKSLKILSINNCLNISFDENTCLGVEKLYLYFSDIEEPRTLLKFPKLVECQLSRKSNYHKVIDFNSLSKLKFLIAGINDFMHYEGTSLEYIKIFSKNVFENGKEILEKISSLNSLKKIVLSSFFIDDKNLSVIKIQNTGIKKAELFLKNKCELYNFQYLFPNLSSLIVHAKAQFERAKTTYEINENKNCKINTFLLRTNGCKDIKFFCSSFENLIIIDIECENEIKNIKDCLPIFNDNCQAKFNSLKKFRFKNYSKNGIKYQVLNNLHNNIDFMPNLKIFDFYCTTNDIIENFYKKFIKKLLLLSLDELFLQIKRYSTKSINIKKEEYEEEESEYEEIEYEENPTNKEYTKEELKEFFPDINNFGPKKLSIKKFMIHSKANIQNFLKKSK